MSVKPEGQYNLAADLLEKKEFTDVVFVVGGEKFPAHKMVLASKSEYFNRMLYGNMRESSQKKITLFPDGQVTPATFQKVLDYAYTESLDVNEPLDVRENFSCTGREGSSVTIDIANQSGLYIIHNVVVSSNPCQHKLYIEFVCA